MRVTSLALAASLLLGGFLHADDIQDGQALAKKSDCLTCHAPKQKLVGPSFVDIAKKYKGKGAEAMLVKKIKVGGAGNWGPLAMSPHPGLPDADIQKMVKWVLAGAPMTAPAVVPTAVPAKVEEKAEEKGADEHAKPKRKKKHKSHAAAGHGHGKAEVLDVVGNTAHATKFMKAQDCFGCHMPLNAKGSPDEKPWPSFAKIQAKYKSGANVEALVAKVRTGDGALKFGSVPHPEYEHLSEAEVQASVQYILAGHYVDGAANTVPAVVVDISKMGPEEWMRNVSDCFSCHAVANKVLGPSYIEVAKRYPNASDATVKTLVAKVKNGGGGVYGTAKMTAHADAPDAMLEKSVRWVLSQK